MTKPCYARDFERKLYTRASAYNPTRPTLREYGPPTSFFGRSDSLCLAIAVLGTVGYFVARPERGSFTEDPPGLFLVISAVTKQPKLFRLLKTYKLMKIHIHAIQTSQFCDSGYIKFVFDLHFVNFLHFLFKTCCK